MKLDKRRGFSIRIFLADGQPDGLKIIEKSNWTGCGVVCPRPIFSEAKGRREFTRTGVYVLVGPSEKSDLPQIYIGEGDPIRPRLEQHASKKDFWTTVIFFTSKDENLNKAHVQFLEARLIDLASEAKRCELENSNKPQLPSLSEADSAEVEGFLDEMLLCFPVIGLSVFEKPSQRSPLAKQLLISAKGIKATGYESTQGFVVSLGSQAVADEVPSIHSYLSEMRRSLAESGILKREGDHCVFTQDYLFNSPSTAAGVVLARSANGRTEWQTKDGRSLKEVQEADAKAPVS
jgi:hypothetical protein